MELKTRALTLSINDKYLIKNIDLDFSSNVLYALIGPNGAGKSTFLKILSGIWKASQGRVFWKDLDLLKYDRHKLSQIVTLVPQNTSVPFEFSVEEIVSMGLYSQGRNLNESEEDINLALEMVGAGHLKKRLLSNLSHGERKLIYIARSLITKSNILLLDEPTASLDICHQSRIWNLLKTLSQQGKTIIVATHDIVAAKKYCDDAIVLNQGECQAYGASTEVLTPSNLSKFFGIP